MQPSAAPKVEPPQSGSGGANVGTAGYYVPALADSDLAARLGELSANKKQALVVANGFTGCLYQRADASQAWQLVCRGELDDETLDASTQLRRLKAMWWSIVDGSPIVADPGALELVRATLPKLRRWLSRADELTGRDGELSAATRDEVAYLAAWRCQFAGCGADLKTHGSTGRRGRFSYYAHIVASSPNGPRGHATRSALLADEADNVMLLCDGCHRLIDRIDPDYYTEELLHDMRRHSISEVRRLLDTLKYPDAEVFAVVGNIAGQVPQFGMREAEAALWESHLRAARHEPEYLFHIGNQQHDVHAPDYWSAVFRAVRSDAVQLQRLLNGAQRGGAPRPRLAVFPLHSLSVMLLAGRILGETGGTHLFQPHRSVAADPTSTRWAWPSRSGAAKKDKFKVQTLKAAEAGANEANLLVSLTFTITPDRLPPPCAVNGLLALPTIEVFAEQGDRGINIISSPDDLEALGRKLDEAVMTLQDEWRVRKVHLFVGAPTTAVVLMGQKMQARHQAAYACYEARERGGVFLPTIELEGEEVREPRSGQSCSLRP